MSQSLYANDLITIEPDDVINDVITRSASRHQAVNRQISRSMTDIDDRQLAEMQPATSAGEYVGLLRSKPARSLRAPSEPVGDTRSNRVATCFEYDDDFSSDEDDHLYENAPDVVLQVVRHEFERRQVVEEILDKEHRYVNMLNFLKTMKDQLENHNRLNFVLPPEDLEKMFPCIDRLHDIHAHIFVPSLQVALHAWTDQSTIGPMFLRHMQQLRIYESFINATPRARLLFQTWTTKEPKFALLVQMYQQNSATQQLSLLDIFHEPYVRLQRWKILLNRYSHLVPSSNSDFLDIPKAVAKIGEILASCEKAIDHAENLEKLLGLEERIDGLIAFLTSDVKFFKDGPTIQVDPRSQKIGLKAFGLNERPLHLFLFNSFLLLCTPKQLRKKHTVRSKISLSSVEITPVDCVTSMDYSIDRCFILKAPKKARLLLFQTPEEKAEWQSLISKARRTSLLHRTMKDMSCADFTCAPIWLPDQSSSCCMLCCKDFTVIRRRHHCRGCGILICTGCSPDSIKLPYKTMDLQIVCTNCYSRAQKFYPALLPAPKSKRSGGPPQLFGARFNCDALAEAAAETDGPTSVDFERRQSVDITEA